MKNLCAVKDLCRAISDFESSFLNEYKIPLNEGLLICCLKDGKLSSGELAELLNLSCSNTSKVLRSIEDKKFVDRALGEKDKRQMYFKLSKSGKAIMEKILEDKIELPELLKKIIVD